MGFRKGSSSPTGLPPPGPRVELAGVRAVGSLVVFMLAGAVDERGDAARCASFAEKTSSFSVSVGPRFT
jgi:hypothetical protein